MGLSIPTWLRRSAACPRQKSAVARNYFRPALDPLEDRVVMASPGSLGLPVDVDLNLVQQAAGPVLEAVFSVAGGEVGSAVMDVTTLDDPDGECTILSLELNEIDLNVLGLGVHTSDICLDITGDPDQGLLGQLLCGLSTGLDLGGVLSGLGSQFDTLLAGLNDAIDGLLADAGGAGGAAAAQQNGGVVDLVNLSLGPVDLNVLGLNVALDNCDDPPGPVTIDVTADPNGGLLGSLLGGLGGIDLGGLGGRIGDLIGRVGDIADQIDDLPAGAGRRVERLLDQLGDAAGRVIPSATWIGSSTAQTARSTASRR